MKDVLNVRVATTAVVALVVVLWLAHGFIMG